MPYPLTERWLYKAIPNIVGGIDQSKQPDALADNQCVTLLDVHIKDGQLVNRCGYANYGNSTGISGGFVRDIQATFQFNRRNGTSELLAITTNSIYKYNVSLTKWLLVPSGIRTTTTAGYAAGAVTFAVASVASMAVLDYIIVTLDNTDQLYARITDIAGLNVTVNTAIPTGRSVASGALFAGIVSLNGVVTKVVTCIAVPGSDWMVFTNFVDAPRYWDGTECKVVPNLPSAGNTICRSVALYNTALFLIGTVEGGVSYPQRIRRSNQTNPTDWTTGTAGYDDLLDSSDALMCARILGPYLIVYKSRSVIRGSFIGAAGLNYQWETTVTHEGAVTPRSVATVGDHHIFIGHNNVYKYAGDFTITPIGDNIRKTMFSSGKDVSPTYGYIIFILFVENLDEIWVCYPRLDWASAACNYALRYNIKTGIWYQTLFTFAVNGGTIYRSENEESEVNFHLHNTFKYVVSYTPSIYVDENGSAIPFVVETKDYIMADGQFRFDMIEMFIQGTAILLQYSTDGGVTYVTMATITKATQGKVRVHAQFICGRVRFKWSGTASNFKLAWLGFSYKIENLFVSGSNVY